MSRGKPNSYKSYLKGKGIIEPDYAERGAHLFSLLVSAIPARNLLYAPLMAETLSFYAEFYDEREETEKDIWHALKVPGIKISAALTSGICRSVYSMERNWTSQ